MEIRSDPYYIRLSIRGRNNNNNNKKTEEYKFKVKEGEVRARRWQGSAKPDDLQCRRGHYNTYYMHR